MLLYSLYRIGSLTARLLPRRVGYLLACRVADLYSRWAVQDWKAVESNLSAVMEGRPVAPAQVREVFRNFSMYLVDFFRFGRFTTPSVRRLVRFEGLEWMEQALRQGKGAIGVTAHLGNYELAGALFSLLRMPVCAVVLSHQNSRVDAFFLRQRERAGVQGIAIQRMSRKEFLESALSALQRNTILGLVADRDYFGHGMSLPLFGRSLRLPTGPAWFSWRTGAPMVPSFVVREKDGRFRFIIEAPIPIPQGTGREEAVRRMTEQWRDVLARIIRQNPTQWYMFQEFWRPGPAVVR